MAHEVQVQHKQAEVVVVTTLGCKYCKRAKEALHQAGVDFLEVEAGSQLDLLHSIKAVTGKGTVPQIFIGEQLLGGSDALADLIQANKLSDVLHNAQGKRALPQQLQELVDGSKAISSSNDDTVLVPAGMSAAQYQQLQRLAADMHAEGNHLQRVNSSTKAFTSASCLEWLQHHEQVPPPEAKQLLSHLLQAHLVSILGQNGGSSTANDAHPGQAQLANARLQLVSEAAPAKFGEALNAHYAWFGDARHPSEVAEGLRQIILRLYDKHLAADGKAVNYAALHKDPSFKTYVNATAELQRVNINLLSREEKMAFFINIYNALVVHALAEFGTAKNFLEKLSFFSTIKYSIGGQDFSGNDIEHGILRGNRASPTNPWVLIGLPKLSSGYFKSSDARAALAVQPMDPRIHFALVCGAKSCPPIKLYTSTSLEEGLSSATMAFCEGEVVVHRESRSVELSKIFKWYKQDFPPKHELFPWLVQYLAGSSKQDLQHLVDTVGPAKIGVNYRHYDWSLNS